MPIPAASLALLMLGPGTTITHAAIHNLADCNCLVVWCGEEGAASTATAGAAPTSADKLLRQAELLLQSADPGRSGPADVRKALRRTVGAGA